MKKGLVLALALCAAALIAAPVANAAPTMFKISMTLPEGHPASDMGNLFGKMLEEKTGGKLTAKSFGSDQIGNSIATVEGLQMGTVEMGNVPTGPVSQFVPSWEVFSLPYLFKDEAHMFRALNGEFGKTLAKDLESIDVVVLGWVNAGSRNVITNKRAIKTPADMKGLKIRVMDSKLMVDTLNAMGGIATPMSQAEVYSALQQGVIDGWENNPTTLYALKLYEVSDYFSWTRHFMTPDVLVISKSVLEALPADQQKIVRDAGKEATEIHNNKIWVGYIADVLEKLKGHNVKFNEVNNVQEFMDATKPVKEAYIKKHGTKYLDMVAKAMQ